MLWTCQWSLGTLGPLLRINIRKKLISLSVYFCSGRRRRRVISSLYTLSTANQVIKKLFQGFLAGLATVFIPFNVSYIQQDSGQRARLALRRSEFESC